MSIYYEKSYKNALQGVLLAKKTALGGDDWSFSKLADQCKVQKTYLSRVFKGDAHLNLDQLFRALDFLDLPPDERQFIELLHHLERSEVPKRRRLLQNSLDELRHLHAKTEKHLTNSSDLTETKGADSYYLDPNAQLVHLFLTFPKYAAAPLQLATKLGLVEENLKAILASLQQLGLITVTGNRLQVVRENLHLPNESNWIKPYQLLTRLKSLQRLQNGNTNTNYAYSLFFSADEGARAEIQAKFFAFLKEVETLVQPASSEKVYQLNFDLIDWDAQ